MTLPAAALVRIQPDPADGIAGHFFKRPTAECAHMGGDELDFIGLQAGARHLGAADAAFARAGLVMDPGAEPTFRRDVERTREVLGQRFESAWQGGRRLSTVDAVRIALDPPP